MFLGSVCSVFSLFLQREGVVCRGWTGEGMCTFIDSFKLNVHLYKAALYMLTDWSTQRLSPIERLSTIVEVQ